jgi:hypothetical protein
VSVAFEQYSALLLLSAMAVQGRHVLGMEALSCQ